MGFISDALGELGLTPAKPSDFAKIAPASAMVIRQKTGKQRVVTLTARGLPYRPFKLTTKQRVELTWLPGTVEAVATVLGPEEGSTTINGYWKDKYIQGNEDPGDAASGLAGIGQAFGIGAPPKSKTNASPVTVDGTDVVNVRQLVSVMDMILREGQLVVVSWDEDVREGFLTEFEKTWNNAHDCEWSMKFDWTSRGEPVPKAVTDGPSLGSSAGGLLKGLGALIAAAQDPKFSLTPDFIKDLQADVATIGTLVNGVVNLAAAAVNAAASPLDLINNVIATCGGIISACQALVALVESKVAAYANNDVVAVPGVSLSNTTPLAGNASGASTAVALVLGAAGGPPAPSTGPTPAKPLVNVAASAAEVAAVNFGTPASASLQSFATRAKSDLFFKALTTKTNAIKRLAVQLRSSFLDQVRYQIQNVHTVRETEELRHISRIYYNSPGHWQDIMIFNGLSSSVVTKGSVLLIPKVPDGQGGSG